MRKLRYYLGMKATIGKDAENAIIFGVDSDGPYIKAMGPIAHTLRKAKDSQPPQKQPRGPGGRLFDRVPRVVSMDADEKTIETLEKTG